MRERVALWELARDRERMSEVEPADVPRLAGELGALQAALLARLVAATSEAPAEPELPRDPEWVAPEVAARVAGVPVARVYGWARGKDAQRYVVRVSRRCMRVELGGFLAAFKVRELGAVVVPQPLRPKPRLVTPQSAGGP